MADSFVQVPADGVGKQIDTRTEDVNGQHRQVIIVGDPTSNAGIAPVSATNGLAVDNKTLPPGAATEATLSSLNSKVTTVNTGAVTVSSSALPTGAATETTLASINTKTVQDQSLDYDTGGGTVTQKIVGIALPASGGPVAGGTSTNPVRTDPTGTTTQPVSGTVTANAGTNLNTSALALEAGNLATISGAVRAEDAPSADGHTGFPAIAVRKATPANTSGTDGDYEFLQMSAGRLWTSATIDAALPAGNNNIGDVDVASLPALTAGNNNIGDVDVATVPAPLSTTGGGTEATALRVTLANDSTGLVSIDDNGGSLTVDGSVTVSGTATVSGDVAHDGVDSGNPVKVGFKAETSPKGITLVADGDRTDGYADADGMQMVKLNTSNGDVISESVSNSDGNSTAFANFSAVVNVRNYITAFQVFRTDAGTTLQYVDFRDGVAGAVLWSAPLPPNGGSNNPAYCGPALFRTSANTALAYDVSTSLTTVRISVSGYQSKA